MSMMVTAGLIRKKREELAELAKKLAEQLGEGTIVQTLAKGRHRDIEAGQFVKVSYADDDEFCCYLLDDSDYDFFTADQLLPITRGEYFAYLIAEAERKVNEVFPAETEVGE